MIHEGDIERWGKTRVVSRIWRCDSHACYCAKAEIIEVCPDRLRGHPWLITRTIWETHMIVQPTEKELEWMRDSLKQAQERFPVQEELG